VIPLLTFALLSGVAGQVDLKDPASRLDFMKKTMAAYNLQRADDRSVTFQPQSEPVLRFNNVVGTVEDGALFFWVDANGRPVAAVQVSKIKDDGWRNAFTSLSRFPLSAGSIWNPSKAGVEFKPVPGALKPADTPEKRLRQMHELLSGFGAEMYLFRKTWHTLRPLSRPLVRYGKAGTEVLDGGLFTFALTTDPEAFLLLEARQVGDGLQWQYAFAPQASAQMFGTLKGKHVWEFPYRDYHLDSNETYLDGVAPGTR
jgi:hypothetical protein